MPPSGTPRSARCSLARPSRRWPMPSPSTRRAAPASRRELVDASPSRRPGTKRVAMAIEAFDDVPALLEQLAVPGASLAFRAAGETRAITWGRTGPEPDAAFVDESTLFAAASISKPVTAFAALTLAADGTLDLDADVTE